jgi:hypothetical protein
MIEMDDKIMEKRKKSIRKRRSKVFDVDPSSSSSNGCCNGGKCNIF